MKRWVLRAILCLLLGAVTTVAVAWGSPFVTFGTNYDGEWEIDRSQGARERFWSLSRPFDLPDFEIREIWTVEYGREGEVYYLTMTGAPPDHRTFSPWAMIGRQHCGWPARAMWSEEYSFIDNNSGGYVGERSGGRMCLEFPREDIRSTASGVVIDRRSIQFPLGILPIGFGMNTLFYAAIWFGVFFGFAGAKRAIRRRRGRCPRCGYDLRGSLAAGCSECGWGREVSTHRSASAEA
jgi:hypothetical protein